jgi:hypothetical protein
MRASPRNEPWWLATEQWCGVCLQGHALGVELHCVQCGTVVCVFCAISPTAGRETVCPECVADAEAAAAAEEA